MGAQTHVDDPRNDSVLVYVNGTFLPRADATISVFDAGFVAGDGVWEGVRLHKGALAFLDAHLERLYAGAGTIRLDVGMDRDQLAVAIRETTDMNGMTDGVHVRIMVTRGVKSTPNQDPRNVSGRATIVIVAEYKQPDPEVVRRGLILATSSVRCTAPEQFDMRLNTHSRLNLILALTEAIERGADEALMLDPRGFVSTCNSTNLFFVQNSVVCTSRGEYCFNGITRGQVIELCRTHGIPIEVDDFTLDAVHGASEAFVTGTFGGLTPVQRIDEHTVGGPDSRELSTRLQGLYRDLVDRERE